MRLNCQNSLQDQICNKLQLWLFRKRTLIIGGTYCFASFLLLVKHAIFNVSQGCAMNVMFLMLLPTNYSHAWSHTTKRYNPVLWGVPKGSYASNPDGPSRIIEYRQMVQVSFSFYHWTFLHEQLQLASLILFLLLQCMEEESKFWRASASWGSRPLVAWLSCPLVAQCATHLVAV